ncbi:MAG: hypothetical protein ACI808_000501 [Paraglaciecola sp.]|jgi:hypothetical protein
MEIHSDPLFRERALQDKIVWCEPYELRGSRTVLRAAEGEAPLVD